MSRPARVAGRRARRVAGTLLLIALPATAEWLQPDASFREAQFALRLAARDTAGHGNDPARLDSLGSALLRLTRLDEAATVYARALELSSTDAEARAALGKIALFRDRLDDAERLLAADLSADRYALLLRRGRYAEAAELCDAADQVGRADLLRKLAEAPGLVLAAGPERAKIPFVKAVPVPLVRVKVNGTTALMAVDTGASDLLLDASFARRIGVTLLPARFPQLWNGSRVVTQGAIVEKLELGGFRLERVPAGALSLRQWSLELNPYAEQVVGAIGLGVLRRFATTLDFRGQKLELARPEAAETARGEALRVPFEIWGENELTVYGSLAGGRRMAMVVQTGLPDCGVGAPPAVFEEVGVKPGAFSRMAKGAGQWLQGRPWAAVTVPSITVGPVAKDKVRGWSGALQESELWRHGVRRDAVLAGDFFRSWRVTFDWQARELVFE